MNDGVCIKKLRPGQAIEAFDCGKEALNRYLIRHVWHNQQTYVALDGALVVDFYPLVVGQISFDDAADCLKKGMARHPAPLMLLPGSQSVSTNRAEKSAAAC